MQKFPLANNINRARSEFFSMGEVPTKLVSETIIRSWQRSMFEGVEAERIHDKQPILLRHELDNLTAQNQVFLENSRPVMKNLFDLTQNSSSIIILTNKTGVILHSLGNTSNTDRVRRSYLQPGAVWSEEAIGTNAVGTALVEKMPISVFGGEHYATANRFLSCSAAPVFDPYGELLGSLDVSGDHHACQQHTLALVRISTQQIENRMFETGFNQDILLHFHSRHEFIGNLNEAIAVFTMNGKLKAANFNALHHLNLDRHHIGIDFSDLFNMEFNSLLARAGKVLEFSTKNGMTVFGRLRVPSSSAYKGIPSSKAIVTDIAPSSTKMTLEALDLGDSMMRRAIERVRKVLGHNIPVLLEGESGTGKELFAQAMHNSGMRSSSNFVALNCAAIPEALIEAELFGYQDGAFTGARRNGNIGRIRQANGGTLFLDEIGDMPLSLQVRLLRVLQERVVTPLGGGESFPVDIDVICATNRNLRHEISAGRFREDLYYRINGLLISLPRLCNREDLLSLAYAIAHKIVGPHRNVQIGEGVVSIMKKHPWPGNIRQMHSVLRTAIALLGNDEEIAVEHLPDDFLDQYNESVLQHEGETAAVDDAVPAAPLSLDKIELMAMRTALHECDNNYSAASRRLGISRHTLYRKLQGDPSPKTR